MSVINKMLRDLDQRQEGQMTGAAVDPALRTGTNTIANGTLFAAPAQPARHYRVWLTAGLLLAALATGAWITLHNNPAVQPPQAVVVAAAPAPPQPSAVAATASVPAAASEPNTTPPGQPATSAPPSSDTAASLSNAPITAVNLRMESSLSAREALDALLSAHPVAPASTPTPAQVPAASRAMHSAPAPAPMTPTVVAATASTPAPTADHPRVWSTAVVAVPPAAQSSNSAPAVQRQQQAGGDAMAQVQSLWSAGSHEAAMDLMQQSIAAAERGAKTGGNPVGNTVLLALVREMTRMQLAEARFGAVWELLARLEPLLGNQPDLWAIRANAAQRLGRHQDSVHAYMMALQSHPDEQRWLLGAAVSLAALGQTSSAAEFAEKARTAGPISKEILAYLRQAGVSMREQ